MVHRDQQQHTSFIARLVHSSYTTEQESTSRPTTVITLNMVSDFLRLVSQLNNWKTAACNSDAVVEMSTFSVEEYSTCPRNSVPDLQCDATQNKYPMRHLRHS